MKLDDEESRESEGKRNQVFWKLEEQEPHVLPSDVSSRMDGGRGMFAYSFHFLTLLLFMSLPS